MIAMISKAHVAEIAPVHGSNHQENVCLQPDVYSFPVIGLRHDHGTGL